MAQRSHRSFRGEPLRERRVHIGRVRFTRAARADLTHFTPSPTPGRVRQRGAKRVNRGTKTTRTEARQNISI